MDTAYDKQNHVGEGRHGGGHLPGGAGGRGTGGGGFGADPPAAPAVLQQPGGQGLHRAPAGATAAHRRPLPHGTLINLTSSIAMSERHCKCYLQVPACRMAGIEGGRGNTGRGGGFGLCLGASVGI